MQSTTTIEGWHGVTKGAITGSIDRPLFIALDQDLAACYAEDAEAPVVLFVRFEARNPWVLDSGEAVKAMWDEVGLGDGPNFHPHTTGKLIALARERGHDAVVIPASAFEGELGYEWAGGTFGEPQAIILDPTRIAVTSAPRAHRGR